jgi:DNA polymerase-3 subunit gamma/tau
MLHSDGQGEYTAEQIAARAGRKISMTTQSLYRKHRPRTYDEVAGQDHVTVTLRNAVSRGQVGHAYLFAGPRGTGKTSMARILAKAVNCLSEQESRPCNACARCQAINEGRLLDLVEIDAASNRGIDEVRDLREKVGFVPSDGNYKVYILDEAHMLTEPAFNALLKTLEEPPPHAIFVLVTTEAHEIPQTIRSRCQRFDFRRIPTAKIVEHLGRIVKEEDLEAEPAALQAIAASATGSMRDAISLLDQMRSYGQRPITAEQVRVVLGAVAEQAVQEMVEHMVAGEVVGGLRLINQMLSEGVEARQLLREAVEYLRQLLLIQVGGDAITVDAPSEALAIMKQQADRLGTQGVVRAIQLLNRAGEQLRGGLQSRLPLELAFVEAATSGQEAHPVSPAMLESQPLPTRSPLPEAAGSGTGQAESRPVAPSAAPLAVKREAVDAAQPVSTPATEAVAEVGGSVETVSPLAVEVGAQAVAGATEGTSVTLQDVQERWKDILAQVRRQSYKAEAALRSSCQLVAVQGDVLVLTFEHDFPKSVIEDPNHSAAVEQAIRDTTGARIRVRCVKRGDWLGSSAAMPARRNANGNIASPSPVGRTEADMESSGGQRSDDLRDDLEDPVVREAMTRFGAVLSGPAGRR